jgi:PAS domain S-box-containing protein
MRILLVGQAGFWTSPPPCGSSEVVFSEDAEEALARIRESAFDLVFWDPLTAGLEAFKETLGRNAPPVLCLSEAMPQHPEYLSRTEAERWGLLKESEQRFRIVADFTHDWEYWVGQDGRLAWMSPSCERITGYSVKDFQLDPDLIYRICHPDDRAMVMDHVHEPLGEHRLRPIEFRIHHRDGHQIWFSHICSPVMDHLGNPAGRRAANQDITERKQSEVVLRKVSTAVEQSPVAIAITDTQGVIEYINPMFTTITGYSFAEVRGKIPPILKAEYTSPAAYQMLWDTLLSGKTWRGEFQNLKKNGEWFWEQASISPVTNDTGAITSFVAIQEDITEQKRAAEEQARLQAQLLQSQKMESLGTLAGGVAHDMNNVLGAILGLASAHIGTLPQGNDLRQALETICKATERGGKMVQSLLSFARQNLGENIELDMNAIVREQVGLLERTTLAKVRLRMDLAPDLRLIKGDSSALNNALMNLCVNAVDAMPENGILTLHTRNVDSDWIEVVVEDTGTGMPKEVQAKALDPFFTTKGAGKGTGLGLSMVFTTVKAHRGELSIQSEPGQGTSILLRFPASEGEAQVAPATKTELALSAQGSLKVLLVDDDDLIHCSMQAIMAVLGHSLATASTGEEAIEKLEGGLEPDVVILDMNMPGLSGAGTLPRLRRLRKNVPIILATGRADQTAFDLISVYPGVILLPKPFGLREIQKQITNFGLG